ncbi:MAG: amidohydrolase [Candidatus Tectomicrobia bacterium]|uniref:Amidohydrolase n=1 Tax=Tectimicrobiota bacterium TaxID=2528274 RepID=A0A937VXZ2_UNCTE|nr:amidohydrolase [Candidatus Tectomicrobia bacterium]
MQPIDIHAHYFPESFLQLVEQHAAAYSIPWQMIEGRGPQFRHGHLVTGPVDKRFIDLDTRLAEMDAQGVHVHVLSLSQPMVYWAKADLAQQLTEVYNDALAHAHTHAPTRLYGLAMLPMHVPDQAVREVERARHLPGIKGFYMATHVNEWEVSHPALWPVYECIEATGLPLFLHPVHVLAPERLTAHYLTNLLGNPFESAVAAAHCIFGGILDRFPRLEIVLPHAGGAFPWLVWRLHRGWSKRADLQTMQHGPAAYLRRFWYDTIGYSEHVIDYLASVVGTDRLLLGSDYCFPIACEQPVQDIVQHPRLDDAAKQAIVDTNARQLLRL